MLTIVSPFDLRISFEQLFVDYEQIANDPSHLKYDFAKNLTKKLSEKKELRGDIVDFEIIEKNEESIQLLFSELFPEVLTHNEIKAVAIPFMFRVFNTTKRLKKIIDNSGSAEIINIRDFTEHQFYIMNCCMIINAYYMKPIDFTTSLFYDIPDENGIMKHYRILYNADFLEIEKTDKAIDITDEIFIKLMDNFDDISIWKHYFPIHSWILRGFGIVSLFDATNESSVSNLKTNLLKSDTIKADLPDIIQPILRSFFKIPDLVFGHLMYDHFENRLVQPYNSYSLKSYVATDVNEKDVITLEQLKAIHAKQNYLSFANLDSDSYSEEYQPLVNHLRQFGFKSAIIAPIINSNGDFLAAIEIFSQTLSALNSVNARKLDAIIGLVQDSIEKFYLEVENNIDLVIQKEYSSIHESVYWKFKNEATKYYTSLLNDENYQLKEIVFREVYPLFGQIDIKGSSQIRNNSIVIDLKKQLECLITLFQKLFANNPILLLEQKLFELKSWENEISDVLESEAEQQIQRYINKEIHPLLISLIGNGDMLADLNHYFESIESKSGLLYSERKKFDQALTIINKKLAKILDEKQKDAQKIYPHYYERFKTDGIEHNLYIGQSIQPNKKFETLYLKNLRLWQFKTMCEMELEHHKFKNELPFPLEVTSLILVMNTPISIRFRMDEKRFDVDGTYNARYEVVKKRIDKAKIKNSDERIVQMGKITLIFSGSAEKAEYMEYANYLTHIGIISDEIEEFDVEDLQGVSGLKAIRVCVIHYQNDKNEANLTLDAFIEKHN